MSQKNESLNKTILVLLIVSFVLPSFCFAQQIPGQASMPNTFSGAKDFAVKVAMKLPETIKRVWEGEALPVWKGIWGGFLNLWDRTAGPTVEYWWHSFLGLLGKKVNERTPAMQEEFQKEKEEMQKDLWERFKDLLK